MKKSLIAMAAGMGSRFGGLKQAAKFGASQKVILDFAIEDALAAGVEKLVFVIRSDIEKIFREDVSGKYENKTDVRYVFQDKCGQPLPLGRSKPWGTGHAVLACADEIAESFFAINADDYYGASSYTAASEFLDTAKPDTCALAGFLLKNTLSENGTVSRGICSHDADMNLLGVREFGGLKKVSDNPLKIASANGTEFCGDEYTSLNFWVFQRSFMDILGSEFDKFLSENSKSEKAEFYLPAAVDTSIKNGSLSAKILPTRERWQGITYREDMPLVEKFLRENGRI